MSEILRPDVVVVDLDGTTIENHPDALPKPAVIDAIQEAKGKLQYLAIATGRPLVMCQHIIDILQPTDLCALSGGTRVYSFRNKNYPWTKEVSPEVLQPLIAQLDAFDRYKIADDKNITLVTVEQYRIKQPVGLSCIFSTSAEDATEIVSIIQQHSDQLGIVAHTVPSWETGKFDIHITHQLGTKKHALQYILGSIGTKDPTIMVVGDGKNDLPMFELATEGYRVAMGNADQELKEKADWIAPSVEDGGLAVAIERFILRT